MAIGVAGYMGSGKSTATGYFSKIGMTVIDADALAKGLMNADAGLKERIASEFGADVLHEGSLNSSVLGPRVFSDSEKLAKFNGIVHPFILSKLEPQVRGKKNVVLDAALISYCKIEDWFDKLYWIHADFEIRKARLISRTGLDSKEIEARMRLQEKMFDVPSNPAWTILLNEGSPEELEESLKKMVPSSSG